MRRNLRSLEFGVCWRSIATTSLNVAKAAFFSFTLLMWSAVASAQGDFEDDNPCLPELSITCPANATVQCEDFPAYTAVPSVTASGCDDATLSVTSSDQLLSSGDCVKVYARTYTAVYADLSESCTQLITVVDQTGPVLIAPPSVTVECDETIPGPATLSPFDVCGEVEEVDVIVSSSQVAQGSNAGTITRCTLTTPMGPGPDGAIWLNLNNNIHMEAFEMYRWVGSPSLNEYPDGTASLTGSVQNLVNATQTWDVEMFFENKRNWSQWSALGRSYKDDLGFGAANFQNWDYYELVATFSNLTGTGSLAGSQLYLSHQPSNYYFGFQSGIGANNRNGNNGMSGWFFWEGWLNGTWTNGTGDLFTEKNCTELNTQCEYVITYTYRAQDGCGNNSFAQQTITVVDTTAPEFSNCPVDITISCEQPVPAALDSAALGITDNCNNFTYLGHNDIESIDGCTRVITRTYRAQDVCGNIGRCTQFITVVDTIGPELVVPANATYNCDEEYTLEDATASDECNEFELIEDRDTIAGQCPQEYQIRRTFTATDDCGNSTVGVQIITVVDDEAPVFDQENTAVQVECTEVETVPAPTASDNCGNVTVELIEEVLNSGGCLGVLQRTYIATDECGNQSEPAYVYITILDTTPPVIENPADDVVECDSIPSVPEINIYDNCDRPVDVEFEATIEEGECEDSYTIIWRWIATDFCDNVDTAYTFITVVDETDPMFTYVPSDLTIACDEDVPSGESDMAVAIDNCADTVTVTYTDSEEAGDCPNERTITRTWRAFDNCGNSAMAVQYIYVVDEGGVFFTFVPESTTILCDEDLPTDVATADDNCGPATVTSTDSVLVDSRCYKLIMRTFTATDLCLNSIDSVQFITVIDTVGPEISGQDMLFRPCDDFGGIYVEAEDNCGPVDTIWFSDMLVSGGCTGKYIRTYYAADECQNVTTFEQIIELRDTIAPEANNPGDLTVECGDDWDAPVITFSDNCDEDLALNITSDSDFDGCITTWTYVYSATDNCNNTTTDTVRVFIEDTTPPSISTNAGGEYSCEEAEDIDFGSASAEDVCDNDVAITYSDTTIAGNCPGNYTIVRTWVATDNCGNTDTTTSTYVVRDLDAPFFTEVPGDITILCDEDVPSSVATADDLCSGASVTSVDSTITSSPCFTQIKRTFIAVDLCGNAATEVQFINIVDTIAPEITGLSLITRPCTDFDGIYVEVEDNCDEDVTVTYTQILVSGGCTGKYIRTYTAIDECQNVTTFEQIVELSDDVRPSVTLNTGDATYECSDEWNEPVVEFDDNCDDMLETSVSVADTTIECVRTITYQFYAEDNCENDTTVTVVITLIDTTRPVIETFGGGDYSCDEEEFDLGSAEASDNCDEDVTLTYVDTTIAGECPNSFIIERRYTAVDDCGNTATAVITSTFTDTEAPSLEGQMEVVVECGDDVPVIAPVGSDNCADTVLLSYVDYPTIGPWYFASNGGDGFVDFELLPEQITIGGSNAGSLNSIYTASTTVAKSVTISFDWDYSTGDDFANQNGSFFDRFQYAINGVTTDITESILGGGYNQDGSLTVTVPAGSIFDLRITATDDQLGAATVVISNIVVEEAPVECPIVDCILRQWTGTDLCGNSAVFNQFIITQDTTAPVFDPFEAVISRPCDNIGEVTVTASDVCSDVTIVPSDVLFSGECQGRIERMYIATDACGNADTAYQIINLIDTVRPEAGNMPMNLNLECPGAFQDFFPEWSDNCDDDLETDYTVVSDTVDCVITIVETWTAEDNCGNENSVSRTVTIVDTTAPVWDEGVESFEITIDCNTQINLVAPTATDACNNVNYNTDSERIDGDCPAEFTDIFTFVAVDDCGNASDTIRYVIHTVDNGLPYLVEGVEGGVFDCTDVLPTNEPVFDDFCSGVEVNYSDTLIEGNCPQSYTLIKTWTPIDACGNVGEPFSATYIVQDNNDPFFNGTVSNEFYECAPENWVPQTLTASDSCDTNVPVMVDVDDNRDECGNGTIVVSYSATDDCGNSVYTFYTVYIQDTEEPVLSEMPENLVLECDQDIPAAPNVEATDNCDDDVTVNFNEVITGETLPAGANARCRLITPDIDQATGCQSFYDNTDWALWLGSLPSAHRYFSVVSGDLIQWNDGSVTFNATFANTANPAWGGFTATVKFVNGKNWAQWSTQSFPTSFKADCGGVDANFQSWMYYILENNPTADLVGYGAYAGSSLNLSHAPVSKYFGFQLGDGANNLTPGAGFGGWFGYSGTVLFNNNPLVSGMSGSGDFSFLLDCCPRITVTRCWSAEDCTGNMVEHCQTITYEGSTSVVPQAPVVDTEATRGDSQVNIVNMFPNPTSDLTQVQVVADATTKVTVDVIDMTGRRVGTVMQADMQPGVIYTFDINAREFNTGLYQVRVMSDKGVSTKQLNVIR